MRYVLILWLAVLFCHGGAQNVALRHADEMAGNLGAIKTSCPIAIPNSQCYRHSPIARDVSLFIMSWDLYYDFQERVTDIAAPTSPWTEVDAAEVSPVLEGAVATRRSFRFVDGTTIDVYHVTSLDYYVVSWALAGTSPMPAAPPSREASRQQSEPAGQIVGRRELVGGGVDAGVRETSIDGVLDCQQSVSFSAASIATVFLSVNEVGESYVHFVLPLRESGGVFSGLGYISPVPATDYLRVMGSDLVPVTVRPSMTAVQPEVGVENAMIRGLALLDRRTSTSLIDRILGEPGDMQVAFVGVTREFELTLSQEMINAFREGFGVHCLDRY